MTILYYPVTVKINGNTGVSSAPWTDKLLLEEPSANSVVVLTEKTGSADPGLYVWSSDRWRVCMYMVDVSKAIFDNDDITVYVDSSSAQSLPADAMLYKNGVRVNGTEIEAGKAIYTQRQPKASGGGGGGVASATSTTSNTIGTGTKTFNVGADKGFLAGQWVLVTATAGNFMTGQVVSYTGSSLVLNSVRYEGSGTFANWVISVSGVVGVDGTSGNTVIATSGAPDNSTGNDGDFAYDSSTQTMYGPKASGVWPAGVVLKGDPGLAGKTILTTTGAPSAGTGANGDYAYDPATQIMYGPKASGVWPAGISIKGDPGTDGNTVLSTTGAPGSGVGNDGDYAYDATAQVMYGPKVAGVWPAGVTIKGDAGLSGNTIITVSGAPANGVGVNGDYAYDPATRTMYGPKAGGVWPAGTTLQGDPGADGNTILTTAGAPANGTGVDGDFALDPTAQIMYGPKAGGVWPAGVSYKGSAGPAGNTVLSTSGAPDNGVGVDNDYAYDPATQTMYGPKTAGVWPAGIVLKGDPGDPGVNGKTIIATTGAPSNGVGTDGDYAIDTAAQLFYGPKAGGAWPAGVSYKGDNGSTIHETSGAPGAGLGVDGDYAIDSTAQMFYGPKAAGAWPAGVSIKGDQGPPGGAGTFFDHGTVSTGTVTLDYAVAQAHRIQAGGDITLAFANWPTTGTLGEMLLELVDGGSHTISFPVVQWILADGSTTTSFALTEVVLQSAGTDWALFWTRDGGSTVYGKVTR